MDVWNGLGYNTIVLVIIAGVSATGLWYSIKHNHDERRRKDEEKRENIRNALKRMYKELKDTLVAMEKEEYYNYRDKDGNTSSYFKLRFHYVECESLIVSPEIRGVNMDMNKIKDVIGLMRENNMIYDWMNHNLPPANEDGSGPCVDNEAFSEMSNYSRNMHWYQEQLRKDIPPILEKIRKECEMLA